MICEVKRWAANCDNCGEGFCPEIHRCYRNTFESLDYIQELLKEHGWYIKEANRVFCPDCKGKIIWKE